MIQNIAKNYLVLLSIEGLSYIIIKPIEISILFFMWILLTTFWLLINIFSRRNIRLFNQERQLCLSSEGIDTKNQSMMKIIVHENKNIVLIIIINIIGFILTQ